MRHAILRLTMAVMFLASCFAAISTASARTPVEEVEHALGRMHKWVGTDDNGNAWRKFLKSDELDVQIAKGEDADPLIVADVLAQYTSGAAGLEIRKFVAVRNALETWLAEIQYAKATNLPKMTVASKEHFTPYGPQRAVRAKVKLRYNMGRLDRFITSGGREKGQAWKSYMKWEELIDQLNAKDAPELRALQEVVSKFRGDHEGLALPQFVAVRESLLEYMNAVYYSSQPDLKQAYETQLDQLAKQLDEYVTSPTSEAAVAIGRRLGWLKGADQAPGLVPGVRRHYARPNVWARVSKRLIARGIEDKVNDTQQISDNILGTNINGTATTQGELGLEMVPSVDAAAFELRLISTTNTNSVGRQGPVTLYTTGLTKTNASKRILIDANGFRSLPASANCYTWSSVNGLDAPPIIRRIAWRKVAQSKGQAESVASRRAEGRFEQRMNQQTREMLVKANESFIEKFRKPLVRRRAFPDTLKFSSTSNELIAAVVQANDFQLGAPGAPPKLSADRDVAVAIHESFIGNLAEAAIAGDTLTDVQLAKLVEKLTGKVPDELKITQDKDPWSITFPASRPITVVFDKGTLKIAIRGNRFTRGEQELRSPMEMSATYKIEIVGTGSKLARQGEVEAKYFNKKPGAGESVAQIAFKTFLRSKFSALFPEEKTFDGMKLPGRWERAGKLQPKQMTCDKGWLSVGWDQLPEGVRTATKSKKKEDS